MKTKLTNKILIPCVAVCFAIFCIVAFVLSSAGGDYESATVCVRSGDTVVENIRVGGIDTFPYEIDCGKNVVCIDRDGVYMKSAQCPDLLCVHQGKITAGGQSIVCLPNKIMIEIVGGKKDVDAVAGAR